PVVFLLVHRAVEIAALALSIARRFEADGAVDALGFDDGRGGVVEVELLLAGDSPDGGGERIGSQRAGGDDNRQVVGNPGHLLAQDRLSAGSFETAGDLGGEGIAVYGERAAGGDRVLVTGGDDERAELAHFLLQ